MFEVNVKCAPTSIANLSQLRLSVCSKVHNHIVGTLWVRVANNLHPALIKEETKILLKKQLVEYNFPRPVVYYCGGRLVTDLVEFPKAPYLISDFGFMSN